MKVLDFGIAILRGAGALPRLTQIDRTVGTPTYMSPEQHLGRPATAAADVYSLGCVLHELLVGDPPFLATPDIPLRAHHLESPAPSVRAARSDASPVLDALLCGMLAKQPADRPSAREVYATLAALVGDSTASTAEADDRDPRRPFHAPLLGAPTDRTPPRRQAALTDAEFDHIAAEVGELMSADEPAEAIRLLEAALDRAATSPFFALELRRLLGLSLCYVGEHRRAAGLLNAALTEYRNGGLPPTHARVVECAYHAGHAYAEIGEPARALSHLRFYVQHVDPADPDRAELVLESRFVIAQLLAADDRADEARAELDAIRPAFRAIYGEDSTHARNLDRQRARLAEPPE